jgi:hypothetical protein
VASGTGGIAAICPAAESPHGRCLIVTALAEKEKEKSRDCYHNVAKGLYCSRGPSMVNSQRAKPNAALARSATQHKLIPPSHEAKKHPRGCRALPRVGDIWPPAAS